MFIPSSQASFLPDWLLENWLEHLFTYSLFFLTIGSLHSTNQSAPVLYLGTLMSLGKSRITSMFCFSSLIQANQPMKLVFWTNPICKLLWGLWRLWSFSYPSRCLATQASSWKGDLSSSLTLLCLATFCAAPLITAITTDWVHKPNKKKPDKGQRVMNRVWAVIVFAGFKSLALLHLWHGHLPRPSIPEAYLSHEAGLLTSIFSLISILFFYDHPKPGQPVYLLYNCQLMLTLVSLAEVWVGISMHSFFRVGNFFYWLAINHPSSEPQTSALFPLISWSSTFHSDKRPWKRLPNCLVCLKQEAIS